MNHTGHIPLDADAFAVLLSDAQSSLYRYVVILTGRVEESRDILQDANLKMVREAATYDPARPFLIWARSIAYFEVLTWRKKQLRERLIFDDNLLAEVAQVFEPETQADSLMLEILEECKDKLPEHMRRAVDLRYTSGLTVSEMAGHLRRKPNTVSASLYRIRQLLSDCIEETLKLRKGSHASQRG